MRISLKCYLDLVYTYVVLPSLHFGTTLHASRLIEFDSSLRRCHNARILRRQFLEYVHYQA
jgi:hypothetical protein